MKRATFGCAGALALCAVLSGSGCSSDDPAATGSTNASDDGELASAGPDAGAGGTASTPPAMAREPVSLWDPELPAEGQFCHALAAIECDGNEDCPGDQLCCGMLNGGAALTYDSIRCQDTCELPEGGRVMCHPGDTCPNPEDECMRSLILPSYMSICGTPGPFTPEGYEGATAEPGIVNCGPGLACADGETCCALTEWDAATQTTSFVTGRCVADASECSCSAGTEPTPAPTADSQNDGGAGLGGASLDGGAGDAG